MSLSRVFTWTKFCALSRLQPTAPLIPLIFEKQLSSKIQCRSHSTFSQSPPLVNVPEQACVPHTKMEYLQKMLIQQPRSPPDARTLKVAVIGCPNAGKSSLVNMLIKWRVCAVSGKAHTTRSKQMAALTKDNVQLVFVDLPGIVNKSKAWKFNLDKAFMRDPHAATFESDLIMVVVDVSHPRSRGELDPEIVKALHYFEDKESILVLNKIDKSRNNPTELLDMTRRLTRGIVHNRRSHVDAYEARFKRRAKLSPSAPMIQPPSELIATYLPAVCHIQANRLLGHLAELRAQLSPPMEPDDQVRLLSEPDPVSPTNLPSTHLSLQSDSVTTQPSKSQSEFSANEARTVSEAELESIEAYFEHYKTESVPSTQTSTECYPRVHGENEEEQQQLHQQEPESEHQQREQKHEEEPELSSVTTMTTTTTAKLTDVDLNGDPNDPLYRHHLRMLSQDDVYFDSVLDALKRQLLLHSATPQEVAARRQRWLDVSIAVQGVTDWTGFSEVFMVSAATGDGIDALRDYLLDRAVPGRPWSISPALVTDREPSELVRMCVWAHCLDRLKEEVPYSLRIVVDDCEKARLEADGDDRIFVHARIQCRSERHLRQVLGRNGSTITEIASAVKRELMTMFRAHTVVKLTAEMATIRPNVRHKIRQARDFADVFPEQQRARD